MEIRHRAVKVGLERLLQCICTAAAAGPAAAAAPAGGRLRVAPKGTVGKPWQSLAACFVCAGSTARAPAESKLRQAPSTQHPAPSAQRPARHPAPQLPVRLTQTFLTPCSHDQPGRQQLANGPAGITSLPHVAVEASSNTDHRCRGANSFNGVSSALSRCHLAVTCMRRLAMGCQFPPRS